MLIVMARRSSLTKSRTTKCKYSALYVACSPCNELPSVDDIAECVGDSVRCESSSASETLPRLVLTVSGKGLKVVRHAAPVLAEAGARRQAQRRSGRGINKVRHSVSDILLAGQGMDSDVRAAVGVVVHGFDSGTNSWLHVHVYWFDDGGPDTAARFLRQISELIDTPQHRDAVRHLESKMIVSGQIRPRSHKPPVDFAVEPRLNLNGRVNNKACKYARHRLSAAAAAVYRQPEVEIRRTTSADDCNWPEHQSSVGRINCSNINGGEYIMWSQTHPSDISRVDLDRRARHRPASLAVPTPVASLASELRARLATGAPILLPPKDYDTVSRSRGNLNGIEERRCANANIVGGGPRRSDSTPQTYL